MTTTTHERVEAPQKGYAGVSVPRKEDKRLVQGEGVFFDDLRRHGMGYVHFVRSPYAHAKIVSVDVSAALEIEGVYGSLTGDEVAILTDPFFELTTPPGNQIKDYALAVGRARHAGEPVAAVVAATRELARDAAELVEVEYEPLEAIVDGERALEPDAPILHEDAGTNVVWSGKFEWGEYDAALAEADQVVRIERLHFDRFSSTPLECAGCLVEYERATGQWTIFCNHQMPGIGAIWMAPALRVGIDKLRFVTHDIGGGFGNKICLHPQFVACCLLARKLGRPVQWTEWRTDQHMANAHGNERTFLDVEVPVKKDGTLLGFSVKAIDDCGAFPRYEPLGCIIWAQVTPGCYRWRNIRVDFTQVCTNKSAVSPNRGYSRMQQLWLTERIVDIVAHELDLDPVEVRKKNYVRSRGHALHDAERLRLRLRRLRPLPRHRARAAGPRGARGAQRGRREPRQAARLRNRLHARLGDEQLRAVDDPQSRAAVLGQQRGGHGQARHLRRAGRDARHRAPGAEPRDGCRPGRGRHPRLLARRRARTAGTRLVLELPRRLLRHLREPVRRDRARRGQGCRGHARLPDPAAGGGRSRRRRPRRDRARRGLRAAAGQPGGRAALHGRAARSSTRTTRACRPSSTT